jgi:hypothetical protein
VALIGAAQLLLECSFDRSRRGVERPEAKFKFAVRRHVT